MLSLLFKFWIQLKDCSFYLLVVSVECGVLLVKTALTITRLDLRLPEQAVYQWRFLYTS